jgi:hypothetical protein
MKAIPLAVLCLLLSLVSCGENPSRRDRAEDWLVYLQSAAAADYRVARVRYELDSGPDAGKAVLLAHDLTKAENEQAAAEATEREAYGKWLDVEAGNPDFSAALASYREALIHAQVAAVRGDGKEFERLRGIGFVEMLSEFRGNE